MRILIAANCKSGAAESSAEISSTLRSHFTKYGITPHFFYIDENSREDIKNIIDNGNFDIVAVSGGDGTISAIADFLAGKDIAMGVIPSGTLNHFAKDLDIPLSTEESVKLLINGKPSLIDTATVNGRTFINNSSIGIYPIAVRKREIQQNRFKRNKWIALFFGLLAVMRKFPVYAVRIKTESETLLIRSPIVFVGNNEYSTELVTLGSRKTISGGKLSLYIAKSNTRWKMIKLIIAACFNRLNDSDELELRLVDEVIIDSKKKSLSVSVDGEVEIMTPPLSYKINRKSLKVILPDKG
ncbi:MAG: sphingosine kinase [Ignavibacteria bacterium]|nr:sphingosine kinase [Ignavibacteria bacterium]